MLSKNFKEILENFDVISQNKEFKGNSFAGRIRNDFSNEIKEHICSFVCDGESYDVKGFPGMMDWAKYPTTFPEFRILNYNSASNFKNGFYLLYRIDIKEQCVDLILAQGRTEIDESILIDISNNLVSMIDLPIPEGFEIKYPNKYSPECIMSKCYKYEELDEKVLYDDLEEIIKIYEHLIPKYLKLICNKNLNHLIKQIRKSGKNKLKLNENCEIDNESKLWLINAGPKGILIDEFKKHDLIAIGKPVGDVTGKNKEEIRKLCQKIYPDEKKEALDKKVALIDKFVNIIKVGDYIISHNNSKNEVYLGKCISNYYFADKIDYSQTEEEYNHYRNVEWLCTIKDDDLSEEAIKRFRPPTIKEIADDIKKEFLDFKPNKFQSSKKRNKIFFGAPGTGKSYNLNVEKDELLVGYDENNYERVTFHPDYTYANFVGTYKPVPKDDDLISYEYVPGPFMRTLVKALKNPSEPFVLIIEEINRANVAAVFGDVFQLLDREKDTNISEYPINTNEDMKNYLKKELKCINKIQKGLLGDNFNFIKIPQNMFIWATMNSADQGVFPMDTAFKRRWDFEYIGINDSVNDKVENLKVVLNGEEIYWNNLRTAINKKLLSFGINEDKLMGPFYAFKEFLDTGVIPEDEFKNTFKNKIIMYLFEDAARSRRDVLFNIKGKENIIFSDICNAFDGENGIRIFSEDVNKDIFNEK